MKHRHFHFAVTLALALLCGYLLWALGESQDRVDGLRAEKAVLEADTTYYRMKITTYESLLKGERECAVRWMTRALVSETDRPHEAVYLATVIRNRVQRGYGGKSTYRGVVTDPYQFSAFNPGRPSRARLLGMTGENAPYPTRWKRMELVARRVMAAPRRMLPLPRSVTHYLTPSRVASKPTWYRELEPHPAPDHLRFAFRKTPASNG